ASLTHHGCRASQRLILRLGASTFLGLPLASKEAERFDAAFEALVQAPFSLVRLPVPGLPWARAMAARKYLRATLRTLIPARRAAGGEDFFSRMVAAMDGLMTSWTEDDLINHFIFLILAAHNPTTSMLAAMAEALADHPEWQERVREEMLALGGPSLSFEALGQMPQTQWVLKEVLRLTAPLGFILRRTTAPLEWMGYTIPAGANVGVAPAVAMRSAEVYSNPERFDPERFAPHRAEDAVHPYAWAPFGGGAHRCIGMHFAQMQAKVFFFHLLTRYRLEPLRDAPAVRWKQVPLATPIGGVPLRLVPLAAS
ncbi:MAG: cytochrome P450, partial [Pseudomonadota bacterium]